MAPLQEGTLVEAMMAVRSQIDFLWQFFAPFSNATRCSAMQEQIRWNFGQADRFHPAFYEPFVLASYATRPAIVLMTHTLRLLLSCCWPFGPAGLFRGARLSDDLHKVWPCDQSS
jgi:hypothetical protein